MITKETRIESLKSLDRAKRYREIIEALKDEPDGLTARELANILGSEERNYVAPRLTELEYKGIVKSIGKKLDEKTKRWVAVYVLNNDDNLNKKTIKVEKAFDKYNNDKTGENVDNWYKEVRGE